MSPLPRLTSTVRRLVFILFMAGAIADLYWGIVYTMIAVQAVRLGAENYGKAVFLALLTDLTFLVLLFLMLDFRKRALSRNPNNNLLR